ncbi:MAG: radical SAM protein [Candidatus Hydrogenedentes bacterium]|nr:radical SAM protein [Candidatus Hydrogenedentota bacterium]
MARNLLKPLNHLDFLRRKETIAAEIGLHNILTPAEVFDGNYERLARHQSRNLSTQDMVRVLASQTGRSDATIMKDLREYATVCHMEFHPTDLCNLRCRDCTYGHDVPSLAPLPVEFEFEEIGKLSQLKAKSMVVIGGGEPTLYRCGQHRFQEMVDQIVATNPAIRLALVTNGTHRPPGNWPNRFSWIRVSLDAGTPRTYEGFRGAQMFDQVIKHFLEYLEFNVPYVGISFLYAKSNVHEYAEAARFIYEIVHRTNPAAMAKVNIQYRPLRRDPYQYSQPFTEAVTPHQISRAVDDVCKLADGSPEMKRFLREQTNVTAILGGNTHPAFDFGRCYYSETFHIVRANGDVRPCFIRVNEPDFVLGNIKRDLLETIALNTLFVAARRKPHCDAHGCRQCHVNYTFEMGLNGRIAPSASPDVRDDPMY